MSVEVKQIHRLQGKHSSAAASDILDAHDIAMRAWGSRAELPNGGLTAFSYLYRRFGPPFLGSDPHKRLAQYILTTGTPGVYLRVDPSGSPMAYCVGYVVSRAINAEAMDVKAINKWDASFQKWFLSKHPQFKLKRGERRYSQECANVYSDWVFDPKRLKEAAKTIGPHPRWLKNGTPPAALARKTVVLALRKAMLDLLRPVSIRDVYINLFGVLGEYNEPIGVEAKPSHYAGYGVPRDAMEKQVRSNKENGMNIRDYAKKQTEEAEKTDGRVKEIREEGVELGFFLGDETFKKVINFMGIMVREMFNKEKGIPPVFFVSVYVDEEKIEKFKDEYCKWLGVDKVILESKIAEENGEFVPVVPMFPTNEEFDNRYEWLFEKGKNFQGQPNGIFSATEAWTVKLPDNEGEYDEFDKKYFAGDIPPSKHPRRSEIAIVSGCTIDLRAHAKMFPIDRDPEGNMIIGPAIEQDGMTFKNNMLEYFVKGYAAKLFAKYGKDGPKK